MLEQLRMQEVSQIILSKPKGAIIKQSGDDFLTGEPIMIINNPSLSNLSFVAKPVNADDAQGHIGTAGITNQIDFVINEGSVLYALWNYIYGLHEENPGPTKIKGNEYLTTNPQGYIKLSAKPELTPGQDKVYVYKVDDNQNRLLSVDEYEFCVTEEEPREWYIHIFEAQEGETYFVNYNYLIEPQTVSTIKQIHNNIFATMDIYIDAVDLKNDDKHVVYIHCDKVQIHTDMVLSVNNSQKTSFTPIRVRSIPEEDIVATIMVI